MPSEVGETSVVELATTVSDDLGIERVEFFDGSNTIAEVVDAPYGFEFLATSVDAGVHEFTVTVTDTSGQTTTSAVVPLAVSIPGGAVVELREQVARSVTGLNHGGIGSDSVGGRVFVSIATEQGGDLIAYNEALSQIWSSELPAAALGPIGASSERVVLGLVDFVEQEWTYEGFDPQSGRSLGRRTLPATTGTSQYFPVVLSSTADEVWTRTGASELSVSPSISAEPRSVLDLADEDGRVNLGVQHPDGGAVIVAAYSDCATGADTCLRRVRDDGAPQWTVGLPGVSSEFLWALDVCDDGSVVAAQDGGETDSVLVRISADGSSLETTPLGFRARTVSCGPGGAVVIGGARDEMAFVARILADGDLVWSQDELGGVPSEVYAVEVSSIGHVFVSGAANLEALGPVFEVGDAFIGRLEL